MKNILMSTIVLYSVILQAGYFDGVILTTKRCRMRPSRITDAKKVYELLTNKDVARFQFGPELNPEQINQLKTFKNKMLIARVFSNLFGRYGKRWIIEDKKTGEFMGAMGFAPVKGENYQLPKDKKYLNVGWAIKRNYWHKGYSTEIVQEIAKRINSLNNDIVYVVGVSPNNAYGIKTANKLQFEDKGCCMVKGNRIIHEPHELHLFVKENNTKQNKTSILAMID